MATWLLEPNKYDLFSLGFDAAYIRNLKVIFCIYPTYLTDTQNKQLFRQQENKNVKLYEPLFYYILTVSIAWIGDHTHGSMVWNYSFMAKFQGWFNQSTVEFMHKWIIEHHSFTLYTNVISNLCHDVGLAHLSNNDRGVKRNMGVISKHGLRSSIFCRRIPRSATLLFFNRNVFW